MRVLSSFNPTKRKFYATIEQRKSRFPDKESAFFTVDCMAQWMVVKLNQLISATNIVCTLSKKKLFLFTAH